MRMEREFALVPMKDVQTLLAAVQYALGQADDSHIEVLDEGTLEEQIAELERMEAKLLAEVEADQLPEITADDLRDYQGRQ